MSLLHRLSELGRAFGRALGRGLRNEQARAVGRLVAVSVAVLACGVVGWLVVQRIPPPTLQVVDTAQNCVYDAASAEIQPVATPQPGTNQPRPQPVSVVSPPGQTVNAEWFIRNTGSCAWNEQVVFKPTSGTDVVQVLTDTLSAPAYSLASPGQPISPTETFAPIVPMVAPQRPGTYVTTWRVFAPNNRWFGPEFSYSIEVVAGAQTVEAAPQRFGIDFWFVVPAVAGIIMGMLRAGQFVMKMYSLRAPSQGIQFAIATTLGLPSGNWIIVNQGAIENAELTPAAPKTPRPGASPGARSQQDFNVNEAMIMIGGPGRLHVRPGSAVLLEHGGGYSRVLGPGEYDLPQFERVRATFDLRTQSFSSDQTALTKDGIPVRARVSTIFRFMRHMPGEPSPPPPQSFAASLRKFFGGPSKPNEPRPLSISAEALRMATYELPYNPNSRITWNQAAHGSASGAVGEAMASRLLDELYAPDDHSLNPRREISNQLSESGKSTLEKRGIELVDSGFGNIQVPRSVIEQRRNSWQAISEKESTITRSSGEAEARLQTQIARAEAQAELIQAVTQAIRTIGQTHDATGASHPLLLRFTEVIARVLDKSLSDFSSDPIRQKEIEKLLERLRQAPDTQKPA